MSNLAFGFFRGIWISLRASNYTNRAFTEVMKNVVGLEKAQIQLMRRAQMLSQIGMMFIAMGAMASMALMSLVSKSRLGARMLSLFGRRVDKALGRIADTILPAVSAVLEVIAAILDIIAGSPALNLLVGGLVMIAGPALIIVGLFNILISQFMMLSTNITAAMTTMWSFGIISGKTVVTIDILITKMFTLGVAIGTVTAGFTIALALVTTIGSVFGRTVGIIAGITIAIIGLAVAIAALRAAGGDISGLVMFGAALTAGGVMGAAFLATQEYQMGTAYVRKGGLAILHGGEEIKSARESKATSKVERERERGPRRTMNYIPITIQNVHTTADKDTLHREIKKALKEGLAQKV